MVNESSIQGEYNWHVWPACDVMVSEDCVVINNILGKKLLDTRTNKAEC